MIDTTKKYWTGSGADDIDEYLRLYTQNANLEIKSVRCHSCGSEIFESRFDPDEGATQVTCADCGVKEFLLDSEEFWDDCKPKLKKCPICKGKHDNVRVGFDRRENGSVQWVYIGNRCTTCGTLGSSADWKIDYEPTDQMEQNI